ncbi:tRNA-splicing endonuclease subunit [Tilletia horrida]|nr:tRNA-splicing endonuclease subunit [Tilletia horrida]
MASQSSACELEASLRETYPDRALVWLANGDALVWNVEDVKLLRTKHNIIGLMTGSLPIAPQQNVFLGLPWQLFPEEVTFLLHSKAIVLIDQSAIEREALLQASTSSASASSATPPSSSPHILTSLTPAPTTLSASFEPYLPSTPQSLARNAVFTELHSRAYFLSTGLRFGGEFVVYPGDPLRYHSHFSTSILFSSSSRSQDGKNKTAATTAAAEKTPGASISALDLVASGRLGTAVKKAHLLCVVDLDDVLVQDEAGGGGEGEGQEDAGGLGASWERIGADDGLATATATPAAAAGAKAKLEDGGIREGKTVWGNVRYYSLTWSGFGT